MKADVQTHTAAVEKAHDLALRGLNGMRERSDALLQSAQHVGQRGVAYVEHAPVKSVLLAVAAGAVLSAALGLVLRSHLRH